MGYSFIKCDDAAAAEAVIATLNGMELEGKKLVAEPAKEAGDVSNHIRLIRST